MPERLSACVMAALCSGMMEWSDARFGSATCCAWESSRS